MGQAKVRGSFEERVTQSIAKAEMRAAKDKFLRENEIIRIAEARRIRERDYPVTHGVISNPKPKRKIGRLPMSIMLASLMLAGSC